MHAVTAGPVLLCALAALLMAGACSKDKAIDEPAKLTPLTRPSLLVKRVWSASVDDKKAVALRLGLGISMANNRVYAAGHRGDVVALDLARRTVVGRWSISPCVGPTGMAIDAGHRRLFSVCSKNAMLVVLTWINIGS